MRRARLATLGGIVLVVAASVSATSYHAHKTPSNAVRRQVIAVYLGTVGTDSRSGMVPAIRDMRAALTRQTAATGREFIARGVSLEPSVEDGLNHLSLFGSFDEVSLGGNWTNSAVVRYIGGNIDSATSGIPLVVLLEREVTPGHNKLLVGPEHEIGRFVGTAEIGNWVRRGAPLPR
jgi:hypothetical protein